MLLATISPAQDISPSLPCLFIHFVVSYLRLADFALRLKKNKKKKTAMEWSWKIPVNSNVYFCIYTSIIDTMKVHICLNTSIRNVSSDPPSSPSQERAMFFFII